MKLKSIMLAGVFALSALSAGSASADMADKALGNWLRTSEGWVVNFYMCGDKLCGKVVSGEGVDKNTGGPVVGVNMLFDLEKVDENRWKGKMYDPKGGGTYAGHVKVLDDNTVKMSGCMMGVMCRSETWSRAPAD
ncbi:MAG: DUF2147 domain-containing protein [Robiginitomaculum sp.]|nr:DUF2147 domain-containing protein [Robiginitomaculum sp.]MDQ7077073.1 DUF2147 domain-containing protein [Robiginitomaculum sp.]